jgi:hypothetical protein
MINLTVNSVLLSGGICGIHDYQPDGKTASYTGFHPNGKKMAEDYLQTEKGKWLYYNERAVAHPKRTI